MAKSAEKEGKGLRWEEGKTRGEEEERMQEQNTGCSVRKKVQIPGGEGVSAAICPRGTCSLAFCSQWLMKAC